MNFNCTLLSFLLFIFFASQTKAQDSSFQLKDYKFRTPGFRALLVDLNLNGSIFDANYVNLNKFQNRSFNTNPNIDYFRIISTDKRQHTSGMSLRPSYYSSFNRSDTTTSKSRASTVSFNHNRMDRFFFKKNFFFETGNEFSVTGSNNRQLNKNSSQNAEGKYFYNKLILGVGKGRLENVQDAQMAMFIVNDLQKMGLLQQDISADKMNELAILITDINNRRVFDNRIRRIYELTRIDSFFKTNNFVNQPSIAYFTTVNDNWTLAFNPGRLAGTVFYFRFNPEVEWNRTESEQKSNVNNFISSNRNFYYSYEPAIGFEKQKPVNLFWQKSMGSSLSFVQQWQRSKSAEQNINIPWQPTIFKNTSFSTFAFNAFYGIGYFPNNRTIINGGFNLNYRYVFNKETGQKDVYLFEPGLFLNADYFVNFRTRFFLNASSRYRIYEPGLVPLPRYSNQRSEFGANISLGFSHVIL